MNANPHAMEDEEGPAGRPPRTSPQPTPPHGRDRGDGCPFDEGTVDAGRARAALIEGAGRRPPPDASSFLADAEVADAFHARDLGWEDRGGAAGVSRSGSASDASTLGEILVPASRRATGAGAGAGADAGDLRSVDVSTLTEEHCCGVSALTEEHGAARRPPRAWPRRLPRRGRGLPGRRPRPSPS